MLLYFGFFLKNEQMLKNWEFLLMNWLLCNCATQMIFIIVRVPHTSKTLVTVNRDAVLALLSQPLPERLPALSQKTFPFLDAWNDQLSKQAEDSNLSSD